MWRASLAPRARQAVSSIPLGPIEIGRNAEHTGLLPLFPGMTMGAQMLRLENTRAATLKEKWPSSAHDQPSANVRNWPECRLLPYVTAEPRPPRIFMRV